MIPWWMREPKPKQSLKGGEVGYVADRRATFECLAKEYAPALYRAALQMTRNADDAQDLLQDTLLRAYSAFDSFTPNTNFRAWALRILTNGYINLYRRRGNIAFSAWEEAFEEGWKGATTLTSLMCEEPERVLLSQKMSEEIEVALSQLSEEIRLTLLLVDVEQLSYEEAAQALEIPIGTVRSRLNWGRKQMRTLLREFAQERRLV